MIRQHTLSSECSLYILLFSCQEILLSSEHYGSNPVFRMQQGFIFGIRYTTVEIGSP